MSARANDLRDMPKLLVRAFCFLLEVIAHGKESTETMPASWVP